MLCLNDIENEKLRSPPKKYWPKMVELHVTIVCASISCPNVRAEAYLPELLIEQAEDNAIQFLSNRKKGSLLEGGALYISSIFSWFNDDFMNRTSTPSNYPDLATFLLKYTNNTANQDIYNYILANKAKINQNTIINYFDYNWDLNGDITSQLCSTNRLCISVVFLLIAIGTLSLIIILLVIIAVKKNRMKYTEVN